MTRRSMDYIPGGVQHNLAFNYPFPVVFTKAEGAYHGWSDSMVYGNRIPGSGFNVGPKSTHKNEWIIQYVIKNRNVGSQN